MKAHLTVLAIIGFLAAQESQAGGWDYLWGKWEQTHAKEVTVVLTPTNIVISTSTTQELWKVTSGTGIVTGLKVQRGDQKLEAKGSVKFNQMLFGLGKRRWLLRKAGSKNIVFPPGKAPNQPTNSPDGDREQSLVTLISASSFASNAEEEVFPRFDSHVVAQGAFLTWRNYVAWWNNTEGTPLGDDRELATQLWAEGVAGLKPKYVYTHGVNIVIVRSCDDGAEEGFYVALSIASSPGPNDERFTRMLIAHHAGGTVHTFRREGHFERSKVEKQKETAPINEVEAIRR
jgi:hypothetical protein